MFLLRKCQVQIKTGYIVRTEHARALKNNSYYFRLRRGRGKKGGERGSGKQGKGRGKRGEEVRVRGEGGEE